MVDDLCTTERVGIATLYILSVGLMGSPIYTMAVASRIGLGQSATWRMIDKLSRSVIPLYKEDDRTWRLLDSPHLPKITM